MHVCMCVCVCVYVCVYIYIYSTYVLIYMFGSEQLLFLYSIIQGCDKMCVVTTLCTVHAVSRS